MTQLQFATKGLRLVPVGGWMSARKMLGIMTKTGEKARLFDFAASCLLCCYFRLLGVCFVVWHRVWYARVGSKQLSHLSRNLVLEIQWLLDHVI